MIQSYLGLPIGTHCASLVNDLVLFCNERDFMLSVLHLDI